MKILWNSTAPWGPSSYSVLTKRTVPDIVRMGHEVVVNTWYGLQGEPQRWNIRPRGKPNADAVGVVTVMPSVDPASYGTDTMLSVYGLFHCDVLISCQDAWVIPPALTSRMKFAPWLPVDHYPCPQGILDALAPAVYPMSFSQWGAEVLREGGIEAHYVPCSADADKFKPMDKLEARELLGVPPEKDMFISVVSANKDPGDRKGLAEALQGFACFAQTHENAVLYMHTNWSGPVNIANLVHRLGLRPDQVMRPEPYAYMAGTYNDDYMRTIYCASDVLLNPCKSEGFGLPMLEAQMCGTPIAATEFSTTDELLFAGWKISGQKHWSIGADAFRVLANIDSIVEALEAAYAERDNKLLSKQARKGAIRFDTQQVANDYWKPALREIEDIVSGRGGELKLVTF